MNSGFAKYVDESISREQLINYTMASTAFPGTFPFVSMDGTEYSDGGCITNVNIARAV